MAALKTPEKTSRRQELRQNIFVDLYARALLFYDEYKQLAQGLGVALLVLILAIPGYIYYHQQQEQAANQQLGQILPVYEQGNFQQALDGTGDRAGLLAIADDYGGTDAGNLATFYAANALYQRDEYDRALTYYQQFEKEKDFIGASAYAAQAAIQENRGSFERAAGLYEQAASQYQNKLTAPRYLLNAGQAYEEAGQYEAAIGVYERIQEEYPDSEQASNAERYLARAKVHQGSTSSS
ncbi:tetratricopeptide (TPR) repeat protein [Salinibacter ruber]|uniref:Tetratricopeptide (TPR) repeat protein n=1 Tax=Salinibacter ruber TaxID=146919 RepID=A0AAW5P7Q3_9BACT|nr:tetratricopeptide repeat protein [Salinibacter ruber]MCS3664626.1 tetratricopeptide (TPR) repeat protein [Salinibacter ruber]MCS3749759.1 tetratricopeptide (TPR) repeat protein [Salinibacter ruber]MCS4158072.1 tetratricopeptide (TPR) repeat protein [Salinibacter ruber]MCS4221693.1 tetratricopeptide (TPR) repeat protein [Salinibacter ruber]